MGSLGWGIGIRLAWAEGTDIWHDAASFVSDNPPGIRFNGDGLLVYPARKAQTGFDGPLASLRLKWIRESVEDYMYIDLLLRRGKVNSSTSSLGVLPATLGIGITIQLC